MYIYTTFYSPAHFFPSPPISPPIVALSSRFRFVSRAQSPLHAKIRPCSESDSNCVFVSRIHRLCSRDTPIFFPLFLARTRSFSNWFPRFGVSIFITVTRTGLSVLLGTRGGGGGRNRAAPHANPRTPALRRRPWAHANQDANRWPQQARRYSSRFPAFPFFPFLRSSRVFLRFVLSFPFALTPRRPPPLPFLGPSSS